MSNIVILHIFYDWREVFFAPVKSIISKVSDLNELFLGGHSGDNMVELLEFLFGKIRELIEALDVVFVKLFFVMEDDIIVSLVEDEPSVSLLDGWVLFGVLLNIISIRLNGNGVFHWEADVDDCWHNDCKKS